MTGHAPQLGVVVIGRNEGERLRRCLLARPPQAGCVYVDSGSVDGSVALARELGVEVVELAAPPRFTAARGRNAGLRHLLAHWPDLEFVQMVDGDCELHPQWPAKAIAALQAEPGLALVFGRLRERFPERSIYNALCDDEWNVPVGEVAVAPGNILCRAAALRAIGGYREDMIAGEDPEMALRLRAAGWRLRRIDAEMALHDAAITRFGQWWRRAERGGHAFAELATRHPRSRRPDWRRQCLSILGWGGVLPALILAALLASRLAGPAALALAGVLALAWPAKMLQIAASRHRHGLGARLALASGALLMIGKFPECLGVARFYRNRLLGRGSQLIEYKQVIVSGGEHG